MVKVKNILIQVKNICIKVLKYFAHVSCSPFAGLPQHEVGQPGLARGPDEEVRGGAVPGVEQPRDRLLRDLRRGHLAPPHPGRSLPHRLANVIYKL